MAAKILWYILSLKYAYHKQAAICSKMMKVINITMSLWAPKLSLNESEKCIDILSFIFTVLKSLNNLMILITL